MKGNNTIRDDNFKKGNDLNKLDKQNIKGISDVTSKESAPIQNIDLIDNGKQRKCSAETPTDMMIHTNRGNEKAKSDIDQLNIEPVPARRHTTLEIQKKSTSRTKENKETTIIKKGNVEKDGKKQATLSKDKVTYGSTGTPDNGRNIVTKQIERLDIIEAENDLLFSKPEKERKSITVPSDEPDQVKPHSQREEEIELQKHNIEGIKGYRGISKFWQTPNDQISSPFTTEREHPSIWESERNKEASKRSENNNDLDDQERILKKCWQMPIADGNLIYTYDKRAQQMNEKETQEVGTPILELQEFLNTEGASDSADTNINLTEEEEASINQLTEELVQVFSPDNIDKTSESQKKELIQRVLKLGGENYSSENLRRDLLKIQMEDMKATFINQSSILNQIMEENNTENQE